MSTGDFVGKDRGEPIVSTGRCADGACANHVYVLESQYERLQENGNVFYCPSGHGQSFTPRKKKREQTERIKAAERKAEEAREAAAAAQLARDRAARTCPWPTCDGRLLASERGLRQHMVKAHGAPWAMPEVSADEVAQVLNGQDPVEVVP